jgi:hypothetical protein
MNKKDCLPKNILLILVASLIVLVLGVSVAQADDSHAAIVLKDKDQPGLVCFGFIPGSDVPLFTTDEIHTTATSSGNVTLTCHFNIPEGFEPTKAVKATGFGCSIFLPDESIEASRTRMIADPGGRATLTCQVNGSQ